MTKSIAVAATVALLSALAGTAPATAACPDPARRVEHLLAGADDWGDLGLASVYAVDEDLLERDGRLRATVRAKLDADDLERLDRPEAVVLCLAVVLDLGSELSTAHRQTVELGDLSAARALTYNARVDLTESTSQILVVIEEDGGGRWGAAVADDAGLAIPPPGPSAIKLPGGAAWLEVLGRPAAAPRVPSAPAAGAPAAGTVIRLVPPRREPVTGRTRFDVIVASDAVRKVVYSLDGEPAAEDGRKPFVVHIDLGPEPRVRTVRAVALDAGGRELGHDTMAVNELDVPFRVRITGVRGDPSAGQVELAADVTVPAAAKLDRVEIYRNEELVSRLERPPFRAAVATPEVTAEDYLRVAAYLADGSTIDDVVLLAFPEVEEVDVNLVEIHVVVTDAGGHPVTDLKQDDFRVVHGGKERQMAEFAHADDVPLVLGLVIDTSGSMELLMHDTRQAAAKFLGRTVQSRDRAFVVDFADQPRLLLPTTGDMMQLLVSLRNLSAQGRTAMYDAIVFSMLQFETEGGRKALVVLTDGDDFDSRYGPKHCADLSEQSGVPVYVIGLGALDGRRRTYSKKDLTRVTEGTGGRLYLVETFEELDAAYAQINAELRSQYTIRFYTDRDLRPEERREVEVRLARPGLEARTVIGTGPASP